MSVNSVNSCFCEIYVQTDQYNEGRTIKVHLKLVLMSAVCCSSQKQTTDCNQAAFYGFYFFKRNE